MQRAQKLTYNRKMNILLAASLYPPETRGPATFAKQLVGYLKTHSANVTVVPFRGVRGLPPGLRHIVYFFKLLFHGRGISVVLALDPVSVGLPALFLAQLIGARFVLRVGGDYAWEQGVQRFSITDTLDEFVTKENSQFSFAVRVLRGIQRYVAIRADAVVVPSKYLKHIVTTWGVLGERISVIHSAASVAPASLSRQEVRERVGWGEGKVIFSAGALVPWKGFIGLIDAAAIIRKNIPDLRLVIAGDGLQKEELKKHAAAAGFDSQTVLIGEVPQTMMLELMRGSDVFALNTGYEGLSHQLIEAMQAEVPIVTTPVGGNGELIEHNVSGLLVPFNDTHALADAINVLFQDPKRASSLAAAARARAAAFTP